MSCSIMFAQFKYKFMKIMQFAIHLQNCGDCTVGTGKEHCPADVEAFVVTVSRTYYIR